jgi:hypothetical protein
MITRSSALMGKLCGAVVLVLALSGCATAPLTTSGSLSAYNDMKPDNGVTTKSKVYINKPAILAAKTVSIIPTSYSTLAMTMNLSDKQRRVIANAMDRSLCIGLSDRLEVVPAGAAADIYVRAMITHLTVTDPNLAGASKVASIAPNFISGSLPIPVPRIPFGMGSLSVEAEAKDAAGRQAAGFVWARGADFITSSPRVAASGDAYDLASEFGADFSKLLVTAESPFKKSISLPKMHRVQSTLGGKPKHAACDVFGRNGVSALVGGKLGAPPEWNDDAKPVTSSR